MLSFQLLSHLLRQAFTCTHTHTLLTACHVRGHTFSLPHSDSLLVSHSHINTHTESSNRCSVSSSGRCSHPHGLSQHRQCFVSHKGSYHPGSGALLGPQQPPPPLQTPERPPEPPHHNLLRCQEEHLCDSGEETLPKFSHWERESCLYSSVCECLSQCACLRQRSCEYKFLGPGSIPVQIINGVREKTECVARPGQFQSMNHVSRQPGCQP